MPEAKKLLENNLLWSQRMRERDAQFFERLTGQQRPKFLWIGCSDSRVPANEIVGLAPGEIFVHRNIANLVVHSDLNCLSAINFAIESLGVNHVIVCGHYGCGGVEAVRTQKRLGLVDNWLRHIQDVTIQHRTRLAMFSDPDTQWERLVEFNLIEQVANVARSSVVQEAWAAGKRLAVHGWVYSLSDGILHDLGMTIRKPEDLWPSYELAVGLASRPPGIPIDFRGPTAIGQLEPEPLS
jgi:carbonic anhydrase